MRICTLLKIRGDYITDLLNPSANSHFKLPTDWTKTTIRTKIKIIWNFIWSSASWSRPSCEEQPLHVDSPQHSRSPRTTLHIHKNEMSTWNDHLNISSILLKKKLRFHWTSERSGIWRETQTFVNFKTWILE